MNRGPADRSWIKCSQTNIIVTKFSSLNGKIPVASPRVQLAHYIHRDKEFEHHKVPSSDRNNRHSYSCYSPLVRAMEWFWPQAICTTCLVARYFIILGNCIVWFWTLSPSCPLELEPHENTSPHSLRARVWWDPHATLVMLWASSPSTSSV